MKCYWIPLLLLFSCSCSDEGEVAPDEKKVEKTNPMVVYMHYMPWFQSKEISGYWGSHWRMDNANPDNIGGDGQREIASHYYPLIGPYDSKDPDVIEYHLLLMKYSGIDGVLVDWYSSFNVNDYRPLLNAANAIVDNVETMGLEFALVYEDYTAEAIENQTSMTALDAAKADVAFMQQNYFGMDSYIKFGSNPLLLTFGPRFFKQGDQWSQIFASLPSKPKFVPLWNHGALTGDTDHGEFSWVDFSSDLNQLHTFYGRTSLEILIGSAYPRFHDYYKEGGWGESYGYVPFNEGQTLRNTLNKAKERNAKYLQLVTWNDFAEGTAIEPTVEDQFQCLKIIQEFTGVPYGEDELKLIHGYYLRKKKYKNDAAATTKLTEAFQLLNDLEVEKARSVIEQLNL